MKILLVGEYSRLHNSLKEGLTKLGHEAVIISTGDAFKQYTTDFSIAPKIISGSGIMRFFNKVAYKLTSVNLELTETSLRFYLLLPKLKGFNHIQLINSNALETHPPLAKWLYKKLLQQNKAGMSLLVCGDETPIIDYYLTQKLKYSVLTPYLANKSLKKQYAYSLKYTQNNYRSLFKWVKKRAKNIITSDFDYQLPMQATGYSTHFIPNPINTEILKFKPLKTDKKIVVFLGINRLSYIKKGIAYFEQALALLKQKYPESVEIIITENLPYNQYIELYNSAHIVLDQVYAYDQGYNALEAMAKGKVVFTGAEAEFTTHYNLNKKVAINALPDVDYLVNELSKLIDDPAEIIAISQRARAFIEKEHECRKIAGKYLNVWSN